MEESTRVEVTINIYVYLIVQISFIQHVESHGFDYEYCNYYSNNDKLHKFAKRFILQRVIIIIIYDLTRRLLTFSTKKVNNTTIQTGMKTALKYAVICKGKLDFTSFSKTVRFVLFFRLLLLFSRFGNIVLLYETTRSFQDIAIQNLKENSDL